MSELQENIILLLFTSPLLFFIIAVSFRLLDNSALLFLQKDIMVTSANVSEKCIKHQIKNHPDKDFRKKLKTSLIYRKMHRLFISAMFVSLPLVILSYYYF